MPNYETREITHGIHYGAFAKIVKKTDGTLDATIVPTIFTGLRTCGFESTQETNRFYADDVVHVSVKGTKTTEGNIVAYQMAQSFLENHLGYKVTAAGGLTDSGKAQNFIWQYLETITDEFGVETEVLNIFYNVSASWPTGESASKEDAVTPKEFTVPCTAEPNSLVLDADGVPVAYMQIKKTEETAPLFDLAYTQILLPTTAIPPTA